MARTTGLLIWEASALTTIPGLCGCLIFGCTRGNPSVTSTTSPLTGEWTSGWGRYCHRTGALRRFAVADAEALRAKNTLGRSHICSGWSATAVSFRSKNWGTMAVELRGWLDAGADQRVINDLEGLREAAERVTAYQEFQPRRCKRRQINRTLRAISPEAA